MLILDGTSDVIRVSLNAAHTTAALQCVTSWRDLTTTAFTPGSTLSLTNGTTPVNIVAAPAASTQRVCDYISILNTDTTTKTVTIGIYDGSTEYDIYSVALGQGEKVEYVEGQGFQTFTSGGALKTVTTGSQVVSSSGDSIVLLGSDVTNNNASANTIADVTALSFAVVSGTRYWFEFFIWYTAAAGTTGSRWSINGPTTTFLVYESQYSLTSTTVTVNTALNAYDLPAASNATSPQTTGGNLARVWGFIQPSANGNVIARFASEVSSSAIVAKTGSYVRYRSL